jgi:hypothetical protein
MPKDSSKRAFPVTWLESGMTVANEGMTLRQWFAGTAPDIAGLIDTLTVGQCAEILGIEPSTYHWRTHFMELVARLRFEYADAMIAESEKNV